MPPMPPTPPTPPLTLTVFGIYSLWKRGWRGCDTSEWVPSGLDVRCWPSEVTAQAWIAQFYPRTGILIILPITLTFP